MGMSEYVRELRALVGHRLLVVPGVSAIVFDDLGRVLLQQAKETGEWGVIGGDVEPGEEPAQAVVREVIEETALLVTPRRVSGVYRGRDITYLNGDRAQAVIIAFACAAAPGVPRVADDESLAVQYFSLDALPEIRPDHALRLRHALECRMTAWFAAP
jgi:8-oxo-dGTP pyrophosphatase MutT (NUDIX family)